MTFHVKNSHDWFDELKRHSGNSPLERIYPFFSCSPFAPKIPCFPGFFYPHSPLFGIRVLSSLALSNLKSGICHFLAQATDFQSLVIRHPSLILVRHYLWGFL
jgi:hypothetical protein